MAAVKDECAEQDYCEQRDQFGGGKEVAYLGSSAYAPDVDKGKKPDQSGKNESARHWVFRVRKELA